MIWGSVFIQLFAAFPLYMKAVYGFEENRIGQLLMINTLMIVTLEMVLMDAVKKFLITRTISLSFLFLGVGFALMPLGRYMGMFSSAFSLAFIIGPAAQVSFCSRPSPFSAGRCLKPAVLLNE